MSQFKKLKDSVKKIPSFIFRKKGVDIPNSMFQGESTTEIEEDRWENYSRSKLNKHYKKDAFMASYVLGRVALAYTPYFLIPRPNYDDAGVKFLTEFFNDWKNTEEELRSNGRDACTYLVKHGMGLYKREDFPALPGSNFNGERPITMKRTFFEIANVQRIVLDDFGRIKSIEFHDGTPEIKGERARLFHRIKVGTTSNYTWGESILKQSYHIFVEAERYMRLSFAALAMEIYPTLLMEVNETQLIEDYLNKMGKTPEQVEQILKDFRDWQTKLSQNVRNVGTVGAQTSAYLQLKYLNTEVKRDIHPEAREAWRQFNEILGRPELLSGSGANKATASIMSKHHQNLSIGPLRDQLKSEFFIREFNNLFMQLGRPELMDSTTVEFQPSISIDPLEDARRDETIVNMMPGYLKKLEPKYGVEVTDEDIAAARDNIARERKGKLPPEQDKKKEEGDE